MEINNFHLSLGLEIRALKARIFFIADFEGLG